jgi:hypothetical protein
MVLSVSSAPADTSPAALTSFATGFALFGRSLAFHVVGNGHALFLGLAGGDFSLDILAKGVFGRRFDQRHYFFLVLADSLNALAVGAPFAPGLRIFSPDPAAIRAFLA